MGSTCGIEAHTSGCQEPLLRAAPNDLPDEITSRFANYLDNDGLEAAAGDTIDRDERPASFVPFLARRPIGFLIIDF